VAGNAARGEAGYRALNAGAVGDHLLGPDDRMVDAGAAAVSPPPTFVLIGHAASFTPY